MKPFFLFFRGTRTLVLRFRRTSARLSMGPHKDHTAGVMFLDVHLAFGYGSKRKKCTTGVPQVLVYFSFYQ